MATRRRVQPSTTQSDSDEVNADEQLGRQRRGMQRRCRFCKRAFTKTEHLLRHERSHTKEKPFSCTICGKAYSRRDTLLRHGKVHEDVRQKSGEEQAPYPTMDTPESSEPLQQGQQLPLGEEEPAMDTRDSHFEVPRDLTNIRTNSESQTFSPAENQSSVAAATNHLAHDYIDLTSYQPNLAMSAHSNMFSNTFPIGMNDPSDMSPLAAGNLWGGTLPSSGPAWLIGYDFDLNALNTSVSAQIDLMEPLFQPQVSLGVPEGTNLIGVERESQFSPAQRPLPDNVRKSWFTHIEDEVSYEENNAGGMGSTTPALGGDHYDVDDTFRARVSLKLKRRTNDDPLPSAKYLNLSIQTYFAKFNPIFPVIHSQTFRPTNKNSLLLLSICSIGSLLIGSKGAVAQGVRIFERLNKAILASWETTILKDPVEAISMIQASLIGQTFGLLSGDPKHLAIVEAFHGTIISWARRSQMLNYRHRSLDLENLSGAALHDSWKKWSRSEEIIRTVFGLYIHDAELASMFHHEPLLRHDGIATSVAASDAVFNAPTAVAWRDLLKRQPTPEAVVKACLHTNLERHNYSQPRPNELLLKPSGLTAYVVLHGLVASICEKQHLGLFDHDLRDSDDYINALICWYFTFKPSVAGRNSRDQSSTDTFCLMSLWHKAFMNLFANFNILERAIGRDGLSGALPTSPLQDMEDALYASNWASSASAQRCFLHAHAVQNVLGTMRLDAEPAIHIPHCLFQAGIASYCYIRFRPSPTSGEVPLSANTQGVESPQVSTRDQQSEFVEFSLRGLKIPSHLFTPLKPTGPNSMAADSHGGGEAEKGEPTSRAIIPMGAGLLCTLTDMLQRIGHWGIARKFAAILETLVHADTNEDWMFT